jgi:UDP-N-acetylglucosamine--N-acetylmuramyl-(pentapeptide) pyrophosphoryl-undecaprenol N-acetylglucosamine transferase
MRPPHILLAAAGTAGHVCPALALAEEMENRGWRVSFAGTGLGAEREIFTRAGIEWHRLPGAPFQRTTLAGRALAMAIVPIAIARAALLLRRLDIDAVLGFGGYASVGPVLAAELTRRFTAIVEPNVDFGLANRILRTHVDRIYAGTHTNTTDAPQSAVLRTGTILRARFRHVPAATASDGGVFVFGEGLDQRHKEWIDEPWTRLAAADLVVCRGGAGTLAETAAIGRAAIIVPLREAAEDHQSRNAAPLRECGAAVVLTEEEWRRDGPTVIARLLGDDAQRATMAARARGLAVFNAASTIVADLAQHLEGRHA